MQSDGKDELGEEHNQHDVAVVEEVGGYFHLGESRGQAGGLR